MESHVPEARLRQCFRCGKYGHTSHACRQKHQTCFKCSEKSPHDRLQIGHSQMQCVWQGGPRGKRRVLPGAKKGKGPNEAGQRRSSPLLASQGLLKGDPKWSGTRTEQSAGIDHADGHDKQWGDPSLNPGGTGPLNGLCTRERLAKRANSPQGEEAGAWGGRAPGRQPQLYQQEHGTSSF